MTGDLVQRCKELLEWGSTGILNKGSGGSLRAYAERLKAEVGDYYAMSVAENKTKDEAMREVVRLAATVAIAPQLTPEATAALSKTMCDAGPGAIAHLLPEDDRERAFTDACDEAGCVYDNEALLKAIADLKRGKVAPDAARAVLTRWQEKLSSLEDMKKRGDLTEDWGECSLISTREIVNDLTAALAISNLAASAPIRAIAGKS